ncbi:MAG: hypothetical protein ABL925_07830 [Methylococcales bacterium]
MSEISKPIQFGNKALKKLKLPLATSEGIDPASIEHYAIIGQSLGALIEGKSLSSNDYLKRTLPISIQFFQTNAGSNGPPPSPTDKPSALIWVEWLKTYPMIKDAIEKQSQSDHHLILRFFEALAIAQDAEALMKGADYFELPLIELLKQPPTPSNGYQNAVLAFAIPKSKGGHKVLFTVRLVNQTVEPFMGCLGPAPDPLMLFMTEAFFDYKGLLWGCQ